MYPAKPYPIFPATSPLSSTDLHMQYVVSPNPKTPANSSSLVCSFVSLSRLAKMRRKNDAFFNPKLSAGKKTTLHANIIRSIAVRISLILSAYTVSSSEDLPIYTIIVQES